MTDRNVQYPYRFHVKPVPGTDDICEIIPAPGTVYEDGTFWNKQNVLQDVVAALYGKDATATPNDIFAAIAQTLNSLTSLFVYGSYRGNANGTGDSQTINLGFTPKAILICNERFGFSRDDYIYGGFVQQGKNLGNGIRLSGSYLIVSENYSDELIKYSLNSRSTYYYVAFMQ